MCGIFGTYSFSGQTVASSVLDAMAEAMAHRGPDALGHHANGRAALGNCRLSVIDLSSASNQPFFSEDGNLVLVQNGEIYNYVELRIELRRAGCHFHTDGDTEVLLRAFEHWGPEFVTRLNGMFAIAVHNIAEETVWIYRDRLGVKPLFLAGTPETGRIWFASEVKAILAAGVEARPDLAALAEFFALNYVPPPATAFQGIRHLMPGHMAKLSSSGISIRRWWDLAQIQPEQDITPGEARAELIRILDDATRIRMRSDAPFGAFLSGGLDSSSVVGFMSLYQNDPVQTFSIGFDNPRFDETRFARMAATRFGTLHQSRVMQQDAAELWPRFIWHVEQPHGDVSFIPTDQVSQLATRDVKMVLTGDGADELFAGYDKYLAFFGADTLGDLEEGWQDRYARQSGLLLDDEPRQLLAGSLAEAFAGSDAYAGLTRAMRDVAHQDPVNQVLYADTVALLPGNNLVKPDRMAMANSLEVRSPFLDVRMVEFALRVPGAMKLAAGETKAIYKKAVEPLLGRELTYRKKQMFTVPVGDWFRQALAGYCRDILLDGRLGARGIVNEDSVSAMLENHIAGTANYTRQLRALISLELWYRLFIDRDPDVIAQARTCGPARLDWRQEHPKRRDV